MTDQSAANAGNPPHKRLQSAHEKYFQHLTDAWNQCQSNLQTIQTEYERALENACQSRQFDQLQAAQQTYQRDLQSACNDPDLPKKYADAYRDYKEAIKNFMATTNVDDLNFTDMAHLSQSLFTVSRMAMCLVPANQGTMNNPFEQPR